MTDPTDWLELTHEELEARWTISYRTKAIHTVLKQVNRQDLTNPSLGRIDVIGFELLVTSLGFPVWLVPKKIRHLDSLVTELMARPTKTELLKTFMDMCEEIPENIHGCPARGVIFNWPHHDMYMTFHDLQSQPLGGHGWFFHRKQDGKRLTLQPLKSLVLGLGDPHDWAS